MNIDSNILELIVSKMDNDSIKSLSLIPSIWEEVSSFSQKNSFWFLRTQTLVERELSWEEGDWKQAYYIFSRMQGEKKYQFDNPEDNHILTSILISLGYDPSRNLNQAILDASENGHLNIVRALLKDKRVDPTFGRGGVIDGAARYNHVDVVMLLLSDKRVRRNSGYHNALLSACMHGSIDVVTLLLQEKDIYQQTLDLALTVASSTGQLEVVSLLLRDGRADPTYADNYCIGASSEHPEVVRLLESDPRVDSSIDAKTLYEEGRKSLLNLIADLFRA